MGCDASWRARVVFDHFAFSHDESDSPQVGDIAEGVAGDTVPSNAFTSGKLKNLAHGRFPIADTTQGRDSAFDNCAFVISYALR
jgi:hypothetical protein